MVLVPIAVVFVVLLGVAIAVVKVMSGKKAAYQRKQWAQGAYSIWTGGEDGYEGYQRRAKGAGHGAR